ncbi:MAG: YsnF/AvaK domain-containing protein [Chloroflexi bacterium]|nr:MAG: YsnF/AvaK domain-containing protein [Chloroflexota bacterium]TME64927.1 MAG: YsnF/AvaK domain-containing protein [Chloroflexota bacterium]
MLTALQLLIMFEGRKIMTTTNRSFVVGVFQDEAQAQQAMNDLMSAGFSKDQIRYSVRKGGSGITNSLENLGLPEDEATFYNGEFESGRTVVVVNTRDRQQEASQILSRDGGYDYASRSGQTTGTSSYANTAGQATDYNTQAGQNVQLREEQLRANKQSVETGAVGLRKDVVSEQQSFDVPVNREEVVIERHAASGQSSDTPIGEGETYRVPVREEQVTVDKQPVVREEVSLGKRQVQDSQRVSDTVRREEARVERQGDVNVQGDDTDVRDSNINNQ